MNLQSSRSLDKEIPSHLSPTEEESSESGSYLGIRIITCLAGLVGIWGVLCLLSGFSHSDGLSRFCASWISAIIGY